MNNRISRRTLLAAGAIATPAILHGREALAQLPKGPVRIVMSSGPGSGSDVVARLVAQKVTEATGKALVIENKPGGSGVVALQSVLAAPRDGSVLLVTTPTTLILQPLLNPELTYNAERDLLGIAGLSETPCVVLTGERADTPKDFAGLIKQLGEVDSSFGAQGIGGFTYLTAEMMLQRTHRRSTAINYRSSPAITTALMQNEILFSVEAIAGQFGALQSRQVRALAVTSEQRLPNMPDVPTLSELLGEPLVVTGWAAYFAPAGTPEPVRAALEAATLQALSNPEIKARFERLSAIPMQVGGTALMERVRKETPFWTEIMRLSNVRPPKG